MTMLTRTALVLLAGAVAFAAPRAARAQDSGLPLGAAAPSATLQTLDGETVDLAQVAQGGPAVIEFWATWCEDCEHLLPAMQRAAAKYGDRVKFVAVAVSVNESLRRVQLHAAKYKVPGVQLFDAKGNATGKWDGAGDVACGGARSPAAGGVYRSRRGTEHRGGDQEGSMTTS
jgi:thiol-disulfide isomerase/thioredoxin